MNEIQIAETRKFCEGYLPECDIKKRVLNLIDKQLPKKPIYSRKDHYDAYCYCNCPTCGAGEDDITYDNIRGYDYCLKCGQRLDFGEEE